MSKNNFLIVNSRSGDADRSTYATAAAAKAASPPYDHHVVELVPVNEIEELRRDNDKLLKASAYDVATLRELTAQVEKAKRAQQREQRIWDAGMQPFVPADDTDPPMPGPTYAEWKHEQRLWEAYMVMLKSEQHETCKGSILAARHATYMFEWHGQEGDKL